MMETVSNLEDILEHIRKFLEQREVEKTAAEAEAGRLARESQVLADRQRTEAEQEFVDEIDALDAASANLAAQLKQELSDLVDHINALKVKLDACSTKLCQLPGHISGKKKDAEQKKDQKLMAIENELQVKERDRLLLSTKLAAKRQKEDEEMKIMHDLLGSSTVSPNPLNYPSPASSPSSSISGLVGVSIPEQAPSTALSPPAETSNPLIEPPQSPLSLIQDGLKCDEPPIHPNESTGDTIQELPPTNECQPTSRTNSSSNPTFTLAQAKCQGSDERPGQLRRQRNRTILMKDVEGCQLPVEFHGKLYILDCPVCHKSDFKSERLSLAVYKHLEKTHPLDFKLKESAFAPCEVALQWCGILIEDATVELIKSRETDGQNPVPSLKLGNTKPAGTSEEQTDKEGLAGDQSPSGPSKDENSSLKVVDASLVMDSSKFIIRDGIYISPQCMLGVPVSMIEEGDEYWDDVWQTADQLVQLQREAENKIKNMIDDIEGNIDFREKGPRASKPDKQEQLKSLKSRLCSAECMRKNAEKAARGLQQFPFHVNQFLSKKYVEGRGFMVRTNAVAFEKILSKLQRANIDQDPLQWLRGRFAIIIEEYEKENLGRSIPLKSILMDFERSDPAFCALSDSPGDTESQDEDDAETSSTINVASSASQAILETTENTDDEEYDSFQKLTTDRKRRGTDSSSKLSRPEKIQKRERESCATGHEAGDADLDEPRTRKQPVKAKSAEEIRSQSRSTVPEIQNRGASFKLRSVDVADLCCGNDEYDLDIRLSESYLRLNIDGLRHLKLLLRDIIVFRHPRCFYSTLRYSRCDRDGISLSRDQEEKIYMTFESINDCEEFICLLEERNPGLADAGERGNEDSDSDSDEAAAIRPSDDTDAGKSDTNTYPDGKFEDEAGSKTGSDIKNALGTDATTWCDDTNMDETSTPSSLLEDTDATSTNSTNFTSGEEHKSSTNTNSSSDGNPCSDDELWIVDPPLTW